MLCTVTGEAGVKMSEVASGGCHISVSVEKSIPRGPAVLDQNTSHCKRPPLPSDGGRPSDWYPSPLGRNCTCVVVSLGVMFTLRGAGALGQGQA